MKFIDTHPDFETYQSDLFQTSEMSRSFIESFQGHIIGHITNSGEFRHVIRIIAKYVPCEPGTNSNFPWIQSDLDDVIWRLFNKKRFPRIMDCILEVVNTYFANDIYDINELLEESMVGYKIANDGSCWEIRHDVSKNSETISETIVDVPHSYENTVQHLLQAKEQLIRIENERARKDALRDCVSALEAHLKYISGKNDFRAAVAYLVDNDQGSKKIIRDALTIWTYVHDEVPEIRHGHIQNVELSEAAVLYWIDRIMSLIKYLSKM
ncbi:hypothetical protein [Cytobacillus oceanisediminis]|uniref:hypothetical protein n=1 Tax=Cytobacillus oceanisediminis TaxID=665099 RepID=UPI001C231C29|nr:hypothetical protein [Cytobacillus oceanisediminis]MBU8772021.1 hypothetical protein [Cytobacillus oceanisediminis]